MLRRTLHRWLCPRRLAEFKKRNKPLTPPPAWRLEQLEDRTAPAVDAVFRISDLGISVNPIQVGDGIWFLTNELALDDPRLQVSHNLNAADTTNADQVRTGGGLGLSLDGTGVTVGVWEVGGGIRATHQEFSGGRVVFGDTGAQNSSTDHATHVAGTIGADGDNASARGAAPKVVMRSYDANNDTTEMNAVAAQIQLSNHSYGLLRGWDTGVDWGIGPVDSWFGDRTLFSEDPGFGRYDSVSKNLDQVLFDNPNLLSVWSAGNDRNDAYLNLRGDDKYVTFLSGGPNGPGYYLVSNSGATSAPGRDGNNGTGFDSLPPAQVAKNTLVVGAIDDITTDPYSNANVFMSTFSSWGPTDDGRVKPDVVANGVSLFSSTAGSDAAYGTSSGTSMSAPNATGSLALLVQHYRNLFGAGLTPRSATLKGLAIQTAFDAGNTGPDYTYGWGVLDVAAGASFLTDTVSLVPRSHVHELAYTGSELTFTAISDGSGPLKATMVWTDAPPSTLPGSNLDVTTPVLVNNLNMTITGPGGTTFYPWRLDPANPSANAVRTAGSNNVDNVEQVLIDAPAAGLYTIHVTGASAFTQAFSLLVSGAAPVTSVTLDGSGNLVITDTLAGGKSDNLTIKADAANSRFVISDPNNAIGTGISGATGSHTSTVYVPFAAVTGTKIIVNTLDGNDTLTVDHSLGLFPKNIEFNGGNPTSGAGDKLIVTGGSFTTIEHTFFNGHDGQIELTGSGTISYTGLEPVDQSGNIVDDLIFNLPAATSDAFLEDEGASGNGKSLLRSNNGTFEAVTFSNPTNSLTINRGNAGDDLTIAKLPDFNRTLTVGTSANPLDQVTVTGVVALAADFNLTIDATTISLNSSSALAVDGSGANTLRAVRNIVMASGSTVFSKDGAILMEANQGTAQAGNFKGIAIDGATVLSVGAGNVTLLGRGGDDAGTNDHVGVYLSTAQVRADGTGKVTITGKGGTGDNASAVASGNVGVTATFGAKISAAAGDVQITGTGAGTQFNHYGVLINLGAQATAGAAGTLAITGTGGNGGIGNYGVFLDDAGTEVTTSGAHITIDAFGSGSGGQTFGLSISSAKVATGGSGNITLNGTRTANASGATSVGIMSNAVVSTAGGNLTVTGGGAGGKGGNNYGVIITLGAALSTGGTGKLSITGTGGVEGGFNHGVVLAQAGQIASITTAGGDISITGTSQSDGTQAENWGVVVHSAVVSAGGAGNVVVNGAGGAGTNGNYGVSLQNGAEIKAATGSINVIGKGGAGTGTENIGVHVVAGRIFTTAGAGAIIIDGTGGIGTDKNHGVLVTGGGGNRIESAGGNISITGKASGTGSENRGVVVANNFLVSAAGAGTITVNGTSAAGASSNTGVLITDAGTKVVSAGGDIGITGTGAGTKFSNSGVEVLAGAVVAAGGSGKLTLTGTGGSGENDNYGVSIRDANTQVTTAGALTITGTGNGSTTQNYGVYVHNSALVATTGAGTLTVEGTGGNGTTTNEGVRISGAAAVTASAAGVSIKGTARGNASGNVGIRVLGAAVVSTTGTGALAGTITLNGTGGKGTGGNYGVQIQQTGSQVATADGSISVTGLGQSDGTGNSNYGVLIEAIVSAGGAGTLTILGTGGAGVDANHGVFVLGSGAQVKTAGGELQVTGVAKGSGNDNVGVFVLAGATVSAAAAGPVTLHGTGSAGTTNNYGVQIDGTGTKVTAVDGALSITGLTQGTGDLNRGIYISGSGEVSVTGIGKITLNGIGAGTSTAQANYGVDVFNGIVSAGAAGALSITGTSGKDKSSAGVLIAGNTAQVKTAGAELSIIGKSQGSTGAGNTGVVVVGGATVSTTGSGKIVIDGTSGAGSADNYGLFTDSTIMTVGGDIIVTGISTGTSNANSGIAVVNGGILSAGGTGAITLNGTGAGLSSNHGVFINSVGTKVLTAGGNLTITGLSNGTLDSNRGVEIGLGAVVSAGGTGKLTITGTGGNGGINSDDNYGVLIHATATQVTTAGGFLTITGTGRAGGQINHGVEILNNAIVSTSGTGFLTITGTGGAGTAQSHGVVITGNASVQTVDGFINIKGITNAAFDTTGSQGILILAGVQSTGNGNVSFAADSIDITGSGGVLADGNIVSFTRLTNTQQLNLGSDDALGVLGLTDAELDLVTAGTLSFAGAGNTGLVTISAAINRSASTLIEIDSGAGIDFAGGSLDSNGNWVTLSATGITTDATGVDVTGALLNITVGAGGVGSNATPLRTNVDLLTVNASSGDGNQFYHEADSLTILGGLSANAGTVTFMSGQFAWFTNNLVNDATSLAVTGGATLNLATLTDTVAGVTLIDGTINGSTGVLTSLTDFDLRKGTVNAALGGNVNLLKTVGADTVVLSGTTANTYTGVTTITNGVLILQKSDGVNAIPGALAIVGGEVRLGANQQITDDASVANDSLFNLDSFSEQIGSLSGGGNVAFGADGLDRTLTVGSATSSIFTGKFIGSDGGFGAELDQIVKIGSGTWTWTGASSFTGRVTINQGTLVLNGSLASSAQAVTVENGATLGGTGTINRPIVVNAGGSLTPGANVGTLTTGDVTLSAGSIFGVEFNGNASGQFDLLDSGGTVALNNANLTFGGSYGPVNGDSFTIIQAATAVTGEFLGMPNGSTVFVSGRAMEITYSGTSVTLTYDATPIIEAGNLDNDIEVRRDAAGNIEVVVDGVTVLDAPEADLTNVTVEGQGGNDTLTLNYGFAGGYFTTPVVLNGGSDSDTLIVSGGNFATVRNTYAAAMGSGNLSFDTGAKTSVVNYSGVEPVNLTGTAIAALQFVLPANLGNAAVLEDAGSAGDGFTQLSSGGTFETTTFANPGTSLEIFSGNAADTLTLNGLPDFDRSLTIGQTTVTGETFDKVTVTGDIDLAADSNIVVRCRAALIDGAVNVSGAGFIEATVQLIDILPGSELSAENGSITINPDGSVATGNFAGVNIDGATITTTGAGNIILTGVGGIGIRIQNGATVLATGAGNIDLFGFRTDGAGAGQSHGVVVIGLGTRVATIDGEVFIVGDSEDSNGGDSGIGVVIDSGAIVESTGKGFVNIEGTGRGHIGIDVVGLGSTVRTKDGDVYLLGTAEGDGQTGVTILNGAHVEATGAGNVSLEGLGGDGAGLNHGIIVDGKTTHVAAVNGNITLIGTARGVGMGVSVQFGARLAVSGSGNVTIDALGDPAATQLLRIAGDDGGGINSGITANTGAVILTADEIDLGAADSITGLGAIVLQPLTSGLDIVLGGSGSMAGKLTLTTGDLAAIDQTASFTDVTIGRDDSSGLITTQGDVSLAIDTLLRNEGSAVGVDIAHKLNVGGNTLSILTGDKIRSSASGRLHADELDLLAVNGIGAAGTPLATQANVIDAKTSVGGIAVSNASKLFVNQVTTSSGDIDLRTTSGNLELQPSALVSTGNGNVILKAAGDLLLPPGSKVEGTTIDLASDADADGLGSTMTLFGTFTTANTIVAAGNGGNDTFSLSNNGFAYSIDGKAGSDTLDFSTILGPVDIDISGPGTIDGHMGKINLVPVSTFDNINAFDNITAPTADAGGPYTISEGQDLVLDGSQSQSSTGLPLNYAWELDGDNDFNDAFGAVTTVTWSQLQSFGIDDGIPPGSNFTVLLRVSDGAAPTDDDDAALTLNNTAATATFSQDAAPRIERRPTTVRFTNQFDPSTADTNAGWTYFYDFNNDGDFIDAGDINGTTSASAQFTFPFEGVFPVHGRIQDKDGGFTDYVFSVQIVNVDVVAFGADKNYPPRIRVLDAASNVERFNFLAFAPTFKGGVRVASGDVNDDEFPEIIAASGPGIVTTVRVFDGVTGKQLHEWIPFGVKVKNGGFVATGDVNNDGYSDVIVSTDAGIPGQVRVFDGKSAAGGTTLELYSFLSLYPATFKGGVRIASGDVNGDDYADIVTVPGSGLTTQVKVLSGFNGSEIKSWTAFTPTYKSGAFVAAGDTNGDGKAEVTVSMGATSKPRVQVYRGLDATLIGDFLPYAGYTTGPTGVRVTMQDRDGDGLADLVVAPGPGVSRVRIYKGNLLSLLTEYDPFGPAFKGGIFVG